MSMLELFMIALGLSMDAFAVAICKGLSMKTMSWKNAVITGLYFGGFQALRRLFDAPQVSFSPAKIRMPFRAIPVRIPPFPSAAAALFPRLPAVSPHVFEQPLRTLYGDLSTTTFSQKESPACRGALLLFFSSFADGLSPSPTADAFLPATV